MYYELENMCLREKRMNYGKKLFVILAAAMGMVIAITGLTIIAGELVVKNPKSGYVLLVIGGFITVYYLNKMRYI